MRKLTIGVVICLALLTLPTAHSAHAWGAKGHRITAEVAQRHLADTTRPPLDELTGGRSLALLSTWPDFIRSDPSWDCAKPWHFLTVEDGQTLEQGMAQSAGTSATCSRLFAELDLPQNVVAAIEFFTEVVRGDPAGTESLERLMEATGAEPYAGSPRLTALAFLVHFIGDVHQPLHVGRGGDRGGNSISTNWFGDVEKLHAVWDGGLIDSEDLSFTEFADFLDQEFVDPDPAMSTTPARSWAQESIDYRAEVYEIWTRTDRANFLPDLSYDYAAEQIGVIKERLYLGGLRVAAVLDSILD